MADQDEQSRQCRPPMTRPDTERLRGLVESNRRTLTDHGRMLWRDDVEGICPTPDMCFEYGEHVRCGPCAIKQATQAGVESEKTASYLPEVCRLRRRLAELEKALKPFADAGAYLKSETIGYDADDDIWITVQDSAGKTHGLLKLKFADFSRAALDGEG